MLSETFDCPLVDVLPNVHGSVKVILFEMDVFILVRKGSINEPLTVHFEPLYSNYRTDIIKFCLQCLVHSHYPCMHILL